MLVDLAVAVAAGAECISDIAVLADQRALFGVVASDSTVWRLLAQLGEPELAAVAAARATAREVVWAQRAEISGTPVPAAVAAGQALPGLVLDLDASIVVCHSEIRGLREQAVMTEFSVGWAVTDRERAAIGTLPETALADAIDAAGQPRDGAAVAELTGLLPAGTLADYPTGTRILIRSSAGT